MTDTPLNNILLASFIIVLMGCSQPRLPYSPQNLQPAESQEVIKAAKKQLGVSYNFGGASPSEGFDCSGLVFYSFQQIDISLPRTTLGQLRHTTPVTRKNLEPGDLVFFRVYRSRVSHVGIYLGSNRFIHAPSTGKNVTISRLDNPFWNKRYIRAGRILRTGQKYSPEYY